MGLLDRLGRRSRTETAKIIWGETGVTNKNAPVTFVPDIIRNKFTNHNDPNHLDEMARKDALANYIVYKLAENALDDWFMFVDADGNEIMQDVQKELRMLNAKKHLTQALAAERTFGHSWLYCGKNRYMSETKEGGRVAELMRFSPLDCVVYAYNDFGVPTEMEITINVGREQYTTYQKKIRLPAEEFITVCSRPIGRGYEGRSALHPVWDHLIYLMYLHNSMTWYDIKIAGGVFTAKTTTGIPDNLKTEIDTTFKDISIRRSIVYDGDIFDKLEFIGPTAGATNFESHIDACTKMVAAGTGIPKDVLIGATAGAITGSETNVKSLFATLNQIQTGFEPTVRELVKKMGYSNDDYFIEWNARYAHDEEEQSKINLNNAQTLSIRSLWLTINELREAEGLPPIEGGDRLKADFQIDVEGMQNADERDQTRNPQGENI